MRKNQLLLVPFLVGLALMVYSWFSSYPLSFDSSTDFIFNHIPLLFWFSIPIMLTSMYAMAVTSKNHFLKWMVAVGIVITLFSLSYFYYTLSSSDYHYFRGLTEYFIAAKKLDPSQPNHMYFQWPSFFVVADTATSVSGLSLPNFEFLLYTIIGFLLGTSLYVYASRTYDKTGFAAVVAFFVAGFYFLNYQCVPFSLAFALVFILFMLETRQKSTGTTLAMLVLFIATSIAHAFVPLFFVIYLLMQRIVNRNKQYLRLFFLTLAIYLTVQLTLAQFSFADNIIKIITLPTEYSSVVSNALAPVSVPIDAIAQSFSRTITITGVLICVVGFLLLLVKKRMRDLDKAVLLTAVLYSGLGVIINTLGSRAIPLALVPLSLGVPCLLASKIGRYVNCLFLILLCLFVFVLVHTSFISFPITFQTKETYTTDKFMIDKYAFNTSRTVLSHVSEKWYMSSRIEGSSAIDTDVSLQFRNSSIEIYDCIVYSTGLARGLQTNNLSPEETTRLILGRFDVIYSSGSSYIAEKPP